ncbi:MAG: hypothetical protein JO372_20935 [Solirubrobacterales bacterium]|nr:hypothetical protein [Solirubrobacterales bacterium]
MNVGGGARRVKRTARVAQVALIINVCPQEGTTVAGVNVTHLGHVEALLSDAAAKHATLISQVPPALQASLPVDGQGVTEAIDYLAVVAGLSDSERRALIRPHAINPAVLHARVFGRAPLAPETVIASFVEGARVRADALAALADTVGGEPLGLQVRSLLVAHPPPVGGSGPDVVEALRETYAAGERAALMIASRLDTA